MPFLGHFKRHTGERTTQVRYTVLNEGYIIQRGTPVIEKNMVKKWLDSKHHFTACS